MGNLFSRRKLCDQFSIFKKCDKADTGDDKCFHIQKCCICLSKRSNVVIYKCGHICMCFICARIVRKNYKKCPICKKKIFDVFRFYN